MANNTLENRVWEKLENKMAIENYSNIEKIYKKGEVKMKLKYMPKVVSFSILAVFLAGNVYTYATENKNIFTWMFERIGISRKYEENSIKINESQKVNNYTLTFENYGLDKDTLIMSFDLKSEKEFEFKFVDEQIDYTQYFYEQFSILNGGNEYAVSDDRIIRMFDKVNEREYKIYEICKIDSEKIKQNSKLKISLGIDKTYDGFSSETIGKWNFEIDIDNSKINMEFEKYSINNKSIILEEVKGANSVVSNNLSNLQQESPIKPEAQLIELKKSNLATKITIYMKEYYTNVTYTVEILDDKENIILDKNIVYLVGGFKTDVILKELDNNTKLKINIYEENDEGKVLSKGTTNLDLAKDLIKPKNNTVKFSSVQWKDLKFKYKETAKVEKTDYDDIHNISFSYKDIDLDYVQFMINIRSEKDEIGITDIRQLANIAIKSGNIYLSPRNGIVTYAVLKEDEQEIENLGFTFNEVVKLLEGRNITKNGRTYTKEDLSSDGIEYSNKIENVSLDNGNIKAVKILNKTSNLNIYMFKIRDNIYWIEVPSNLDYSQEVDEFIDNIKLIKNSEM